MLNTKKKTKGHITKKKVGAIHPRDYTYMGTSPQFVHFNPSGETYPAHTISHRLEKWILIILLAFAMAAFMAFKLVENSDFSFSMSESNPLSQRTSSVNAAHSVGNDAEFKEEFNKNRKEARALMEEHNLGSRKYKPKFGKAAGRYYAVKKSRASAKKFAKKVSKKKFTSKVSRKKAIARR